MKLTLDRDEVKAAVACYLDKQGIDMKNKELKIRFSKNSINCEVDDIEVSVEKQNTETLPFEETPIVLGAPE